MKRLNLYKCNIIIATYMYIILIEAQDINILYISWHTACSIAADWGVFCIHAFKVHTQVFTVYHDFDPLPDKYSENYVESLLAHSGLMLGSFKICEQWFKCPLGVWEAVFQLQSL